METKRPTAEAAEEILGGYFPVLDHGFVALVDYMGTDQDIESAARVSYGAGTRRVSQTRGLVRYLQRHAHTTPSEMVEFKFHCSMPMFVARQWVRHRTASVNEYSARYSLLPLLFYEPEHAHFAHQSSVNNQGREADPAPVELHADAVDRWQELRRHAADTYGWLLAEDVARELARIDLPLSTYTQWYWKIDLHNLLHFLTLRVDDHAQWEIQEYGRVMAGMLARVAPIAYEAWLDYNVLGARLSHAERMALAKLLLRRGRRDRGARRRLRASAAPNSGNWDSHRARFANSLPRSRRRIDRTSAWTWRTCAAPKRWKRRCWPRCPSRNGGRSAKALTDRVVRAHGLSQPVPRGVRLRRRPVRDFPQRSAVMTLPEEWYLDTADRHCTLCVVERGEGPPRGGAARGSRPQPQLPGGRGQVPRARVSGSCSTTSAARCCRPATRRTFRTAATLKTSSCFAGSWRATNRCRSSRTPPAPCWR